MTNKSTASKLQELFDLFQSGAITKEEYELLKGDIIHERVSESAVSQRLQENSQSRVERKPVQRKRGINKWVWPVLAVALIAVSVFLFRSFDSGTGTFTDPRDGQTYKWVKMGDQVWMAENLAFRPSSGNYWAYDNNHSNVFRYGYLYDWETACRVCPPGWHLPSDEQWTQLIDYVESQGYPDEVDNPNGAAYALRSCRRVNSPLGGDCSTTEHPRWDSYDTHYGFDEFGFSALPGGYRFTSGSFTTVGYFGDWWSSTEHTSTLAWGRLMGYSLGNVYRSNFNKAYGFSLRCVRD